MRSFVYLVALTLVGCATPEQIEARRQQELAQQQAAQAAYRERVFGQCRAYGFTEGTEQFRQCLMQVDMANQQQNAATRQMILQQYLQQQNEQEIRAMPYCSSLPPVIAGYRRAQGTCR